MNDGNRVIFFAPIIAAIIAATIAAYVGIEIFLKKQKMSRVQRVYYEDSLLDILRHFDEAFNITNKNKTKIESILTLIKLNQSSQTLKKIANEIKTPTKYFSYKRDVLISLFGKYGYKIQQWLFKFDNDNINFNSKLLEYSSALPSNVRKSNEDLKKELNDIDEEFGLVLRHWTLGYLLDSIVSIVGALDFKTKNELVKDIENNGDIKNKLEKIDEAFKTLFAYYKQDEDTFFSYLKFKEKDKITYRIKLTVEQNEGKPLKIEKIKYEDLENDFKIVRQDFSLAGLKITVDNDTKLYSTLQLELVNWIAFDKEPMFYKEAESFEKFDAN